MTGHGAAPDHTALNTRNFLGLAFMSTVIGLATVGIGAVDLVMIAPKGATHVAAVGLGDLVIVAGFSFFGGVFDIYSGRLATSEGAGTTAGRLPVLAAALAMLALGCGLLALAISAGVGPGLRAAHQDPQIIPLVRDYIDTRLYGAAPLVIYGAIGLTLRLTGAKTAATVLLMGGFVANIVLNALVLYTPALRLFPSPESAVAASTVALQVLLSPVGIWLILRQIRRRSLILQRPTVRSAGSEFRAMAPPACGFGAHLFNDYLSATIPILFIGTLGATAVAATAVATKIYALYCRVPQGCFDASFALYGYAFGRDPSTIRDVGRRVLRYCAAPTVVAGGVVVGLAPWLVSAFGGANIDHHLATVILLAYMLAIPAYFFDQLLARLLKIHRRSRVLLLSSLLTWAVTIPLAWVAVFELSSPFLAIAARGLVSAACGVIFWRSLRQAWVPATAGETARQGGLLVPA